MEAVLERNPVAKKKGSAKRIGRPPLAEGPRIHVLGIRGREAWKEWLIRFAEHCRSDMVDLVDDALESYAKAKGFEQPPKR
jgi:hypothetical protein